MSDCVFPEVANAHDLSQEAAASEESTCSSEEACDSACSRAHWLESRTELLAINVAASGRSK